MNELERLIAGLARPEPSDRLDDRIQAMLAQEQVRPRVSPWRIAISWCGTAACMGVLGFYLGRQTAIAQPAPAPVTSTAQSIDRPVETTTVPVTSVSIPLRADQLAGLFMPPAIHEGMLGRGPVTIQVSTSAR
ncbi:MAG TPA: hypothetical protein VG056_08160 [Pirellulales bacterium]|jgi:hypothetical protein|nr:hypothetical protein [Pirellulales bacterium]